VNATTQYVKYGEIKYPAELISSTVLGGVAGPLMANGGLVANITYGGGFATLNSVFTNTYYTPLEKERDNLVESFVFGGIGGGTGKWLDSYLVKSWISGIPQYVRPQGYNPELGALLNPVSAINSQYGSSVLVKDIASGLTGAGTETLTKETWGKVNTK